MKLEKIDTTTTAGKIEVMRLADEGRLVKAVAGPFSKWLRDWRKKNRYSLGQLSDFTGLSTTQLFELEHGNKFNPRLDTMIAISKATKTRFTRVAQLAFDQRLHEQGSRAS